MCAVTSCRYVPIAHRGSDLLIDCGIPTNPATTPKCALGPGDPQTIIRVVILQHVRTVTEVQQVVYPIIREGRGRRVNRLKNIPGDVIRNKRVE